MDMGTEMVSEVQSAVDIILSESRFFENKKSALSRVAKDALYKIQQELRNRKKGNPKNRLRDVIFKDMLRTAAIGAITNPITSPVLGYLRNKLDSMDESPIPAMFHLSSSSPYTKLLQYEKRRDLRKKIGSLGLQTTNRFGQTR